MILPIRYKTIQDGTSICDALGERETYLEPFEKFEDYVKFYNSYLANKAVQKHCDHGGRYFLWLPYIAYNSLKYDTLEDLNITYYKSNQQLMMRDAFFAKILKRLERDTKPICMVAKMGKCKEWRFQTLNDSFKFISLNLLG